MANYDFETIKEKLCSPALLDIIDSLGYRNQGMDYKIRPLVVNNQKSMGRAFTVNCAEEYRVPEEPYKNELAALDHVGKGEIMVVTTQGSMNAAFFGELMATRCIYNGAVGAVIDGSARDCAQIEALGFPLFCSGISPLDSKGRLDVIGYNVPIRCGGVLVQPQDIIFADRDGIAVIPAAILDEVIEKTLEKLRMEDIVRAEINAGSDATTVYNKYHIL